MRSRRLPSLVLATLAVAACADEGPVSGPGTLTATLASPNGPEGAAVVAFFGPGIGDPTPGTGELHWLRRGDTVRAVWLDQRGGELVFTVAVADTTRKPGSVVLQVAGPDDRLRTDLSRYALEFGR